MSGVVIKPCNCNHAYQDKTYGRGVRVMNYGMDKKSWTCTVCGKEYKTSSK